MITLVELVVGLEVGSAFVDPVRLDPLGPDDPKDDELGHPGAEEEVEGYHYDTDDASHVHADPRPVEDAYIQVHGQRRHDELVASVMGHIYVLVRYCMCLILKVGSTS
jgi:hypothetical protein